MSRFGVLPVLALVAALGLACDDDDDAADVDVLNTQIDAPVIGGGAGPRYEETQRFLLIVTQD